ncbi:MAG: hypothetical protein LKJ18_02045 [Ancrocorticia sp.]|jgi:hypothetical protein|nr:hypothetical protein [Ancrocorticia sp.]MCI1962921.1 hypothetical protein [Ancrocorticia sp.]MCI2001799.1 hypothetical protein [Ancrocorticia sp.]MCI2001852.1 hypothetical protein [Ancrocorticia sp.]
MREFDPISDYTPIAKDLRDKWNSDLRGKETANLDEIISIFNGRMSGVLAAIATLEIKLGISNHTLVVSQDAEQQFISDPSRPDLDPFRID